MHSSRYKFIPLIRGRGLEIGALNDPLPVEEGVEVLYSDILSAAQVATLYPGSRTPDIISDSEHYPDIVDGTFDFVIANHVLEHVTDPIQALNEWYRILAPKGVLFMAVPDKRRMFDYNRPRTTLDHLIEDHLSTEPPKYRNFEHLKQWATHVENLREGSDEWQEWIDRQFTEGYSVHNHVWILEDILALLRHLRRAHGTCFQIAGLNETPPDDIEFILILRAEKQGILRERLRSAAQLEWYYRRERLQRFAREGRLTAPLRAASYLLSHRAHPIRHLIKGYRNAVRQPQRALPSGMKLFLPESNSTQDDVVAVLVPRSEQPERTRDRFRSYIESSRAGSLCSLPRRLPRGGFFGTHHCELIPGNNVQLGTDGFLHATGPDPQLSLQTSLGRFPSGPCLVTFRWEAESPCDPTLYFETDHGVLESERIRLCAVSAGCSVTLVHLPQGIKGMRFDPIEVAGPLPIRELVIRELSLMQPEELSSLADRMVFVGESYNTALNEFHREQESRRRYSEWVRMNDRQTEEELSDAARIVTALPMQPLVSILIPTHDPRPEWLTETIESVRRQVYPNWQLCIADDFSTDPSVRAILKRYAALDPRIEVILRSENGHISAATNSALLLARGELTAFLDHDDLLHPLALAYVVAELNAHPDAMLIYTDEDKITTDYLFAEDSGGRRRRQQLRYDPHFKSDWNAELLLSQNFICHLAVYRTELLRSLNGLRLGRDGAQDWDLALRAAERIAPEQVRHIPRVLYHWRAVEGSTAHRADAKPYALERGAQVVREAFERRGIRAEVSLDIVSGEFRIRQTLDEYPLVSIIIPTSDQLAHLERCVAGIFRRTSYPRIELLVIDNRSQKEETIDYLRGLNADPRVSSLAFDEEFNFSRINNFGARAANGEILVFLNDDTQVINEDWLTELVSYARWPTTGAVGAKLFYPDGSLQHAGVVLGVGGIANHAFYREPGESRGYRDRLKVVQNYSAVTGACLAVRKDRFCEIGGFDEQLSVAFGDVDLCLRLMQAGLRNIWTPHAQLYHHESLSRGSDSASEARKARLERESALMRERYGAVLDRDPHYNPNLTVRTTSFELEEKPRLPSTVQALSELGELASNRRPQDGADRQSDKQSAARPAENLRAVNQP